MGFGDKRVHWSDGLRGEERASDRDLGNIMVENPRGFLWPEFVNGDSLGSPAAAEGHLARGGGVAHP
jgi:hypothetical protein